MPRLRRLDPFPQLQTTSDVPGAPDLPPAKPGPALADNSRLSVPWDYYFLVHYIGLSVRICEGVFINTANNSAVVRFCTGISLGWGK